MMQLTVAVSAVLWLAVIIGTYSIFPDYRATPPEGVENLSAYPRALIRSNPDTAWLHSFAMESKEHLPWIAAMLATAVAFTAARRPSALLADARVRSMSTVLLATCFVLVAFNAVLGTLINKVAPLQ